MWAFDGQTAVLNLRLREIGRILTDFPAYQKMRILSNFGFIFLFLFMIFMEQLLRILHDILLKKLIELWFDNLHEQLISQSTVLLLFHPISIFHLLEYIWHCLHEVLIVALLIGGLLVHLLHDIVEHQHDEVIVILVISILEYDGTIGEVIIRKCLYIIDASHYLFQLLVGWYFVCQRVLGAQVVDEIVFNMIIYDLEVLFINSIFLTQGHYILEDILRAIDFNLIKCHLLLWEIVECWGKYSFKHIWHP